VLSELQRILVTALHDERPAERLAELAAAAGPRLDENERAHLTAIDADGLRVASIVVRKLRLERVLGGDRELQARCVADPAAFADTFRRYAAAVPPKFDFPADEARAFRAFLAAG
jgi:hypothetical protein